MTAVLCVGNLIVFILQLVKVKHKERNKPAITLLLGGSVKIKMSSQTPGQAHTTGIYCLKEDKEMSESQPFCRNHPANQGQTWDLYLAHF